MIIGCTGNYRKTKFYSILEKVHEILSKRGIELIISDDLIKSEYKKENKKYNLMNFDDLVDEIDVLLAIGGDGTILSTVRRLADKQKPIMGIHIGGLGFLSECMVEDLENSINDVINGNYKISDRMLLEASFFDGKKNNKIYALNDVVVNHGPSARILKTEVFVSNHYLNTYEGDGLIISSPTGSTAYSMSAGGPIIYPDMSLITVTPICSHSLSARPIVLNSNEIIKLNSFDLNNDFLLTIDGQTSFELNKSIQINISKAPYSAKLINLLSSGYFDTLRTKMGWSGNIR